MNDPVFSSTQGMQPRRLCTLHASSKRLIKVYCLPYLCFFSQNFLISIKNLSGAAIFILRRCFRSSSLPAFCKIGVLKTSAEFLGKHICRSLFSTKLQTFQPKILNYRLHHRYFLYFSMSFAKILRTPFYRTPTEDCF